MASRFWVGGTGNWDAATTTHWSASSGGGGGASVPTSADDVTFDSNSGASATVTITAAANANSITINKSDLTLLHNAGSTVAGFVSLTTGTLNTNGQTCSWKSFDSSNSNTRTITLGASSISLSKITGAGWDTTTTTNLTFNANTSTITFTCPDTAGNTVSMNAGSLTYNSVAFAATGSNQLAALNGSNPTFANFTVSGFSGTNSVLTLGTGFTVTTALTLTGTNSGTSRLLINSVTVGTPQTITSNAATNTMSNLDLQDITGAGTFNWNLSGITNGSGDCGGNSGITFSTPRNLFWVGNAGNWSTVNKWSLTSGGTANQSTPLAQDNLTFDSHSFNATGQTVTINMNRAGKNIDFTNVTNSPTLAGSFGNAALTRIYGNLTLVAGMSQTITGNLQFEGRSSNTLTTAGLTFGGTTLINAPGGTLTFVGDFACSTANNLTLQAGTLTATTGNVTCGKMLMSANSSPAVAKTLNMGSGTWTVTSTGIVWNNATSASLTINAQTSTIVINDTSATLKTFNGNAGFTYNNLTVSGDNVTIAFANTFNNLNINNAGLANGLKMSGSTQTINGTITTNGSAGNLAILTSSGTSTLSKTSGTVSVDYMNISNSHAGGGATYYAGIHSTDGGGNTGWIFEGPNSGTNFLSMM